jgi:adenosylcobyric acid synthase
MVLGTASNVGKSLVALALCRRLRRCGRSVAPFKALNIALNSYPADDGGEVGTAQAQQAVAAGLRPSVDMNPVLIKAGVNGHVQYVIHGRVEQGYLDMSPDARHEALLRAVTQSYRKLSARHEVIILEGSGSPVEVNLKDRDVANLAMAKIARASCVLVADIERGGVFASVLGTWQLLTTDERRLFVGFIINKFHGDPGRFAEGVRFIEKQIGLPCLGVIPALPGLRLKSEDALDIPEPTAHKGPHAAPVIRIGVVSYPNISNFTDFDALALEPSVEVRFCRTTEELAGLDLVILPGTKVTISDLFWLREHGFADALLRLHGEGVRVFGICGGMQMLGTRVEDPEQVETVCTSGVDGLGLLPLRSRMLSVKVTTTITARMLDPSARLPLLSGYEIHVGESEYAEGEALPLFELFRPGEPSPVADGAKSKDGRAWGTYIHGLFDNDCFRLWFLNLLRRERGTAELSSVRPYSESGYVAEIDRWTDHATRHLRADFLDALARLQTFGASV